MSGNQKKCHDIQLKNVCYSIKKNKLDHSRLNPEVLFTHNSPDHPGDTV